jgi:hypothetical protein
MAESFAKLVVRAYSPRRRAILAGAAAFATLCVLYAVFELGRYDGGFRVIESVRSAFTASARIRDLESENSRLRTQLEGADVARRVDREGYKQVERSLGDMQSQIARLSQDLSFYRGLVQPETLVHVKVHQMQILPEPGAGRFRLKFVLMQTGKPDNNVTGNTVLSVDGINRGKPMSLSLVQLTPNHRVSLAYSFRYYQDYDEVIQLPPGFEPTRVGVEIHTGKDTVHGFRQAFVWKSQGMSIETEAGSADSKGGTDVQVETE